MSKRIYLNIGSVCVFLLTGITGEATAAPQNSMTVSRAKFGCVDKSYFDELSRYAAARDQAAWMSTLQAGLSSGQCVQFSAGEAVLLEEGSMFSGLLKVRRPGGRRGYWTTKEGID